MMTAAPLIWGICLLAAGAAAAAEGRKIKLRTICFEHVEGLKKVTLTGANGQPVGPEIPMFTSAFSDEVEVAIPGDDLRFVAAGAPADATTKPVATGKAVAGERQLVVFIPAAQKEPAYRLLVIDDSDKAFPLGSTLAYNLASEGVRFMIGEHRADLPAGGQRLIPKPTKLNEMNQANVIISFVDKAGKLVPVNSTRWLSSDRQRSLAIAFIHPRTRQPTVNSYTETPPWHLPTLP